MDVKIIKMSTTKPFYFLNLCFQVLLYFYYILLHTYFTLICIILPLIYNIILIHLSSRSITRFSRKKLHLIQISLIFLHRLIISPSKLLGLHFESFISYANTTQVMQSRSYSRNVCGSTQTVYNRGSRMAKYKAAQRPHNQCELDTSIGLRDMGIWGYGGYCNTRMRRDKKLLIHHGITCMILLLQIFIYVIIHESMFI